MKKEASNVIRKHIRAKGELLLNELSGKSAQ